MKAARKKMMVNHAKIAPYEDRDYMSPNKSSGSVERAFRNGLALQRTYT